MGIQILHPAAGDFRLARKDRAIILGVASAVLAVCLWLIVQTAWPGKGHGGRVGPSRSQSRKARHFSTREATLVQAGATLVTAILCIVGTVQNILANRFLCAFLSSCQALIQGANGELVFERFLIVHPDYKLRILKKVLIHTYIFSVFIFPYLFLWVVALALPTEDPGGPPNSAQEGTFANLDGVYRYWAWAAVLVLFLSVPGRILFDVVMGCSTVTRIYELRLKVRTTQSATNDPEQPPSQEQQQAQDDARQLQQQLLVMCVKILTYVAVSVLLNLLIHVPPAGTMTPVFVTSVNLCVNVCYALLTYFCFGKRGRGCWRPSWERIIRRRRDAARPHFTRHPMFTTDRKKSKRRGKRNLRSSSSSSSSSGQGKSSSSSSAVFTSPPIKTSPFSPLQQWRESMMFQNTDEAPKMELYRLSEECNGGVSSGSESGQDETAAGGGGGPGGGARTGSGNVGSQANSETSEFYVLRETLLGWTSPRSLSTHGPGEELDVESGGGGEGVFTAEEECKDERRMRDASA